MGVLYLVRHGQADPSAYGVASAVTGGGLTDRGVRQARRAGLALRAQIPGVSAAISGTLPRQRQTLDELLAAFADPPAPMVDPGWDEYPTPAAVAAVDRSTYADRRAYQDLLDQALTAWSDRGEDPGPDDTAAETYAQFCSRITAAAEQAAALAGRGQAVVVVSSAGVIAQLVGQIWSVPDDRWPVLARTMINAAVTKLIVGGRGMSVVSVNTHDHLLTGGTDLSTFR